MIWAATITTALVFPALAQDIVGKAVVDGRLVNLMADRTWTYAEATETGCKALNAKVSFCGQVPLWTPAKIPTADVLATYRYDAATYGQFIIEDVGTAQGLNPDFMRSAVLSMVEQQVGEKPTVVTVEPVTLGTLQGETLVYSFQFRGVNTVFANSIFLTERSAFQAMTYAIADNYTPAHKDAHAAFLEATRLTD
jgi:hypothetical protein